MQNQMALRDSIAEHVSSSSAAKKNDKLDLDVLHQKASALASDISREIGSIQTLKVQVRQILKNGELAARQHSKLKQQGSVLQQTIYLPSQ